MPSEFHSGPNALRHRARELAWRRPRKIRTAAIAVGSQFEVEMLEAIRRAMSFLRQKQSCIKLGLWSALCIGT